MKSSRMGAVTACFFCLTAAHAGSSWAAVGFEAGRSLETKEFLTEAKTSKAPDAPQMTLVGSVLGEDAQAGQPGQAVEWVTINGGKFAMEADRIAGVKTFQEVSVETFEMAKTVVTVEQYAECVIKGQCTEPETHWDCNWGKAGRQLHPVNCVDWAQANQYAKFKDARLPSESEWEYAAKSGGRTQEYPWGNEAATCERAVMKGSGGNGCGSDSTMPVCSKPAGNTAQGLCDMAGNVWQWVQESSEFRVTDPLRVICGSSWIDLAWSLRSANRDYIVLGARVPFLGIRLVRSTR